MIFRDTNKEINIYRQPEERKFWTIEDFYYERRQRKNRNVQQFDVPILLDDDVTFDDDENNIESK